MTIFLTIGIIIAAYLIGSIPFGIIIARLTQIGDLRKIGSGNIGASNVFRSGNKIAALCTLLLDAGKGFIGVLLAWVLMEDTNVTAIAAVACVLGHCYPVWLGFKGGKGIATGFGALLFLAPYAILLLVTLWFILVAILRIASVGSLVICIATPVLIFWLTGPPERTPYTIMSLILAAIIIWRHRSNIRLLIRGKESKIGS